MSSPTNVNMWMGFSQVQVRWTIVCSSIRYLILVLVSLLA